MSQVKDQAQKAGRYQSQPVMEKIFILRKKHVVLIHIWTIWEGKKNYGGKRGRFRLLGVSDESSDGESSDSDQMNDDNGDGKEEEERKQAANHVLNGVERGTADKS